MLTAIQQPFFVVVFILLGICMIACLIAAIRGPELGDRIVAANMIGIKKRVIIVNIGLVDVVMFNPVIVSKHDMYETIATICLLSYALQQSWLLDVALIYTMISFLAVVVLTRIFIRRYKSRAKEQEKG